MRCPVRGHRHDLVKVLEHVQQGTGIKAGTWECPSGSYRWFVLEGRELSDALRVVKPRWGWS